VTKVVAFLKRPAVVRTVAAVLVALGVALTTGHLDIQALLTAVTSAQTGSDAGVAP
jgi:hypothetical protein